MHNRSGKQGPTDLNELAFRIVGKATEPIEPALPDMNRPRMRTGQAGGLVGGKARAERLAPERRSQITRSAARKGWESNNGH